MRSYSALTLALLLPLTKAYFLTDFFIGYDFFRAFEWEAIPDPTNGRVNYVDQQTAIKSNLSYATWDSFVIRADAQTVLDPAGPGRNSVRIRSKKKWGHGVYVFDVRHMPQGCTTWPALWTVIEDGWPSYGEIDVIEGVNDVSPNAMTLHSGPNCTMPSTGDYTGTTALTDCDTNANGNAGCGIKASGPNSYGPGFNQNHGGIYVVERTSQVIKVWFFPRNQWTPLEVLLPSPLIDTRILGKPQAAFPSSSTCDLESHFKPNQIIINLTLCGDWAGNVYGNGDGCPGTGMDACKAFVNDNPAAFKDAYWDIKSIRVYQ